MIPNTKVQTKQEFMDMLSNIIPDNGAVLWTQNISVIEFKKKLNEKRVTLGFAADAFRRSDSVGDLMGLNGYLMGVCICDKSVLSEGAKLLVPEVKKTKQIKK